MVVMLHKNRRVDYDDYEDERGYCDDNWIPYEPAQKRYYDDPVFNAVIGYTDDFDLDWDKIRKKRKSDAP
jgi:hypothetical protein